MSNYNDIIMTYWKKGGKRWRVRNTHTNEGAYLEYNEPDGSMENWKTWTCGSVDYCTNELKGIINE